MLGLCSVTFRDKSPKEIIKLVKDAGLETIEWASDPHVPETNTNITKEIALEMNQANLKTSSYGTYYRLGTFENFQPYIETAKILNAPVIRIWAGKESSINTSQASREKIIEDAKRISKLASKENLIIGLEYHLNTLTDTPESAIQLMKEINLSNMLLYWQPAENLSIQERLESIPKLAPWIINIHIFHWENYNKRFPLADGFDEWKKYIEKIEKNSPHELNYLLEFVPEEDQIKGFFESTETLKQLVK